MDSKEMEARLLSVEKKVQVLEDIEDIQKLQRAYGFYLEHWMAEDIIDLFADGPDTTLMVAAGQYHGKDAIVRFFHHGKEGESRHGIPELLHQVMQLSGVIHVDPNGKKAHGRWYGFGANAFPAAGGKANPGWMNGVYEIDYVKENGKWKLKKVHWCMTFRAPWTIGFIDLDKQTFDKLDKPYGDNPTLKPTGTPEQTLYPSGFICPFHFANPVSGRPPL
jgi:hypothetical protein